jgi:hypothetical protein
VIDLLRDLLAVAIALVGGLVLIFWPANKL